MAVVLRTGFAKSLISQMFACVKRLKGERGGVLVCPLKSLIADQIDKANAVKAVERVSPEILEQPVCPISSTHRPREFLPRS